MVEGGLAQSGDILKLNLVNIDKNTSRYQARCHTKMVYQDMEEDYPNCRVETVKSCKNAANRDDRENLLDPDEECVNVKVNKCYIAKRKVRKAQPNTQCERVPVRRCTTHKCTETPQKCEVTVKTVKEFQPQESCSFRPRRVCQKTGGIDCRTEVTRVCREVEGGGTRMQLVCNGSIRDMP